MADDSKDLDPRFRSLDHLPPEAVRVVGMVAGAGILGGAVWALWDEIRKQPGRFLLGLGVLVALGAFMWAGRLLRRRFGPASSFRNPAALRIGRKYLYGRGEAIEALQARLRDQALVFLVGESGAGKSALLEQGLVPELCKDQVSLPVYLKQWGTDWVKGPADQLADALWRALSPELRERLGLQMPLRAGDLFPSLVRLYAECGITPILLFDQLDDYLARHRQRFLSNPERRVLPARDLVRRNTFWKGVASLLKEGQARVLMSVRDDASWGLESFRFQEPELYPLPLLGREAAMALLDQVFEEAAVEHPERGFQQLRRRLVEDLAPEGWVLPIQMRVGLQGLADLSPLSPLAYAQGGGLSGLEARHVARSVAQAVRTARWSENDVLQLLVALVDQDSRKTEPRTPMQLLAALPPKKYNETSLVNVLSLLRDVGVDLVREGYDPEKGEPVWLLDHDYLCRGVLAANRRTQRWSQLLRESTRAFEQAQGLWGKWKALLVPDVQLRILWERLRERLTYGDSRRFALASSVRMIINVWVFLIIAGLLYWRWYSVQESARKFLNLLEGGPPFSKEEAEALWALSRADIQVRRKFLDQIFDDRRNAGVLNRWGDGDIVHALFGLEEDTQDSILADIFFDYCTSNNLNEGQREDLCRHLIAHLTPGRPGGKRVLRRIADEPWKYVNGESSILAPWMQLSRQEIGDAMTVVPIDLIMWNVTQRSFSYDVVTYASLLAIFRDVLPEEYINITASHLIGFMEDEDSPYTLVTLARSVERLGDKVSPYNIRRAAAAIVSFAANPERDTDDVVYVLKSIPGLGKEVPPLIITEARKIIADILRSQEEKGFPKAESLMDALHALDGEFPSEVAKEAVRKFVEVQGPAYRMPFQDIFEEPLPKPSRDLKVLFEAPLDVLAGWKWYVVELVGQLPDSEREEFAFRIIARLLERPEPEERDSLIALFEKVSGLLSETSADRLATILIERPGPTVGWGIRLLSYLSRKVPSANCSRLAGALLPDFDSSPYAVEALGNLGSRMKPGDGEALARQLYSTIGTAQYSAYARGRIAVLARFGNNLSPDLVDKVAHRILLELEASSPDLEFISSAFDALSGRISGGLADKIALGILAAIETPPPDKKGYYHPYYVDRLVRLPFWRQVTPSTADLIAGRLIARLDTEACETFCLKILRSISFSLSEQGKKKFLREFSSVVKPLASPPCDGAAALGSRDEESLRALIELLKWPTCRSSSRNALATRLSELTGKNFGSKDSDGEFHANLHAVAEWAEQQGFHPEEPPAPPELIRSY